METIDQAIRVNRAYFCLDCGKCTSVCPISWRDSSFSPRALVEAIRLDVGGDILRDSQLWECLTCARCTQICPSDVHFIEFVRDMRSLARDARQEGPCSHGSAIQTWMRMMAKPELQQSRLDWLVGDGNTPDHLRDLRVSERSDTLYFVGCLPYYQVLFDKIGAQGVEIAQSGVRVLNYLGIEPMVLADERCCGHDLLWEGEVDTFRRLVEINSEMIRATGAQRIVTTCAECARTLKMNYDLGIEVLHIAQLLAESDLQLPGSRSGKVTYQDPCRLGRHMEVYDEPRQVITASGMELVEMPNNRARSICCGTSAWTHCGATSKRIQVDRLREAQATGAELLVTSCAKCQIHFKCAQEGPRLDESLNIEIRDLVTLIAELCVEG